MNIPKFVQFIVSTIRGTVDEYTTSADEKMLKEEKLTEIAETIHVAANDLVQAEIEAKARIIEAELAQGDNFTKRARPFLLYAGMITIIVVHVLLPLFYSITIFENPGIELPWEFWVSYGGTASVYSWGRSKEKMGASNKFIGAITGSGMNSVLDKFKRM